MEFYIMPDMREKCERKLTLMFKHWSQKPKVEYSDVQKVVKTTVTYYHGEEGGYDHHREKFDAIKVTIDDITASEWTLVAEVVYSDGIVAMVNKQLFKSMPERFGLDYKKCDFCGGTHTSRAKAYVIYNNKTNEWMQVGSTCISKLVQDGKYLSGITVKLHEFFEVFLGGCDEEQWAGGWRPKGSQYFRKAIRFDYAVAVCEQYMKENGEKWQKAKYDDHWHKIASGTNDWLQQYELDHQGIALNKELYDNIVKIYATKEGGYDYYGEPDFVQKVKDGIESEYIEVGQMFLAWFAIKEYKDSLTYDSFRKVLKEFGINEGEKYLFVGTIDEYEMYESTDWYGHPVNCYDAHMTDSRSGLEFRKSVSYKSMLDAYKIDDNTYAFMCYVRNINEKKRIINVGGRVSKAKGYKYINK